MKTIRTKRNSRSDVHAIRKITDYGLARVLSVDKDTILQEFVKFDKIELDLGQLADLLKQIHANSGENGILVHGDYSVGNTTMYKGIPKCFDYEYVHYGNPYVDIGRVVLRSCTTLDLLDDFFRKYSRSVPANDDLRKGFIYFCDWQHLLRQEKGLPYQNVPVIRKQRLVDAKDNLESIFAAFTSRVEVI